MLQSRDFLFKLTQSVRKIGKFFFEFEKKNLLTAAKAPLCIAETLYTIDTLSARLSCLGWLG